jgi:hypothetical protein
MSMLLLLNYFVGSEINFNNKFYAAFDSIEDLDEENAILIFDTIESKSFELIQGSKFWKEELKINPAIITIRVPKRMVQDLVGIESQRNKLEGNWFRIFSSSNNNDRQATIMYDDVNTSNSETINIGRVELIKRSEAIFKNLREFFSYDYTNRSNPGEIAQHLKEIDPNEDNYNYNVYNVGQGSLTAITCLKNIPVLYYDLGGAFWIFPDSYPNTLRVCFCIAKTIILSHWDLDHVETARRLLNNDPKHLKGITWILPRQPLTPFYASIAKKMGQNGRLLFWSNAGEKRINFWGGHLIKCTGKTKNDSGIALYLNKIKNHGAILNPGDAKFGFIDISAKENLTGLVASHHGGNFDFDNTPNSISRGDIAYSHGNKYGHPTLNAVNNYERKSWVNRIDTTGGSISFSFNTSPIYCGCGNPHCDLSADINFE